MKLVIGGFAQGKLSYVTGQPEFEGKSIAVLDETTDLTVESIREKSFDESIDCLVINHLHLIIKRMITDDITNDELPFILEIVIGQLRSLYSKAKEVVIISDEIGNGVVPMEKKDSIWREAVGRVLVMLAKDASKVTRVSCGIGTIIK